MKKVELNEQEWGVVLQAIHKTPTQDLETANQLMSLIQQIQIQLAEKEEKKIKTK